MAALGSAGALKKVKWGGRGGGGGGVGGNSVQLREGGATAV